MADLVNKHDELSKKFLTNIEVAKSFLQTHLQDEIKVKCDFSTLSIEPCSYIDNDLRKRFSDVVYRIELKDNTGCIYIYTLIEHQSSAEKLMPVRILRYQLAIIQDHIDKYKYSEDDDRGLPLVIPLVLYNGVKSPYPYSTSIYNLFADKEIINKIRLGTFKLIDLTTMPDEQILKHGKVGLLEMLEKHIRIRDLSKITQLVVKAIEVAHKDHMSKDLFDSALSYLINAREGDELKPLFNEIILHVSEYKEELMSYAEELRLEGEHKAQHEIATQLLKSGVDSSIIADATHLSLAELDKIKKNLH